MTAEIVERVRRSARYRDVDPALVERIASEELAGSRNLDDAVKRVKRRLHQAVGAFGMVRAGHPSLRDHASTRERLPHLDRFYPGIWRHTGIPGSIADLGCGLNPLTLPWMGLAPHARYLAVDIDRRALSAVRAFMLAADQPHEVRAMDLVREVPDDAVDVALLLKLITTLDRQDSGAAARLLSGLRARHAVVSFTTRTLGGRADSRAAAYRRRLERLAADADRVGAVAEASVPGELVFVLALDANHG